MKKLTSPLKNLLFLSILLICTVFSACEKTDQPFKIRINQFKQTATAPYGPIVTLSAQVGSQIGSVEWSPFYDQIVGFNYEAGYIYDLLVVETEIIHPQAGGSNKAYQLRQVLSKTKVADNITFELTLKNDLVTYVKGDATSGYKLLDEANIDCGNLCTDFANALQSSSKKVGGKFTLNTDGSIKLIELLY